MTNSINNTNEIRTITIETPISANVFVIPNGCYDIAKIYKSSQQATDRLAKLNYTEDMYNNFIKVDSDGNRESKYLTEVWMYSNEVTGLKSDNLRDHGFSLDIDGETYFYNGSDFGFMTQELVTGWKEGECKEIKYCLEMVKGVGAEFGMRDTDMEAINVNLTLTVTASQLDSRYRRFGKFEDIVAKQYQQVGITL